jgi:hypothetical protein
MNGSQIQAMLDGLSSQAQKVRRETQMTLGRLIERLEALPPETPVSLGKPHSYRGYYEDLAFDAHDTRTAGEALAVCRRCMGKVFCGYKGGDFQMGELTPVWRADYGCTGRKITGIEDDGTVLLADDD